MVSFICDVCQETVKKSKVEGHVLYCKSCYFLSCVDCGVRFSTEEYTAHNSCISEAQKYEGRLYNDPNKQQGKKKKTNKNLQERWMDVIKSTAADKSIHALHSDPVVHDIIQHISKFDNVPRKKAKFFNFLTSSIPSATKATQVRIWDALERAWREDKAQQDAQASAAPSAPSAASERNVSKKREPPTPDKVISPKKAKKSSEDSDTVGRKSTSNGSSSRKGRAGEGEGEGDGDRGKEGKWEEIVWKMLRTKSETTLKKVLKRVKKKGFETDVDAVKEFLLSLEGVIELKIGDHVVRVTM